MRTLFIADKNTGVLEELAAIFSPDEVHITMASSIVDILQEVRARKVRVLLMGSELNGGPSVNLVPLLLKCNDQLRIIVVADEISRHAEPLLGQGALIYYGPLPVDASGREGLVQAVRRAFTAVEQDLAARKGEGFAGGSIQGEAETC